MTSGSNVPKEFDEKMLTTLLSQRKSPRDFTPLQENSLYYYAGYVIRLYLSKHKCTTCENFLCSKQKLSEVKSMEQVFTAYKSYSPNQMDLFYN